MNATKKQNDVRDQLASIAATNDGAEMGMVLTMGVYAQENGDNPQIRTSLHHVDGLDLEAGEHLLKHMVEAWRAWPEVYRKAVERRDVLIPAAEKLAAELRTILPARYEVLLDTKGKDAPLMAVRDREKGSVTMVRTELTAAEIKERLLDRRNVLQYRGPVTDARSVEAREGEAPNAAGEREENR